MIRPEKVKAIVVTLLEDEKNFIERFYPIVWEDYQFRRAYIPQKRRIHLTITQLCKGFSMEYLDRNLIDADNDIFVKLCEIDKRLGVFNEDHILVMALGFFAFDLIQNNKHIKVC